MTGRDRLALAAQAAGYGPTELEHTAIAALPGFMPGQQLTDPQLATIAVGVELLAEGGLLAEQLVDAISHYRDSFHETWRLRFWRAQASIAAARERARSIRNTPPPAPERVSERVASVVVFQGLDTPVARVRPIAEPVHATS